MGVGLQARQAGGLIVLSCKDFRSALGYRRRTGACTPISYRTCSIFHIVTCPIVVCPLSMSQR
jgi:hypothetical protein